MRPLQINTQESTSLPPAAILPPIFGAPAAQHHRPRVFHGYIKLGVPSQMVADQSQPALQTRVGFTARWRVLRNIHRIAHAVYPGGNKRGLLKRIKFVSRAWLNFVTWQHWYDFVRSSAFSSIAEAYPRLYEKPLRPYLHKDLSHAECHRILREHYLFLERHASPELTRALLGNEPFLLNSKTYRDLSQPLVVNLTYAKHMQQEGELTLSIGRPESVRKHREHEWITSLTFVVQYGTTGWEILIGGIQGGHTEHGREDVRCATHVLHGFRPKYFLVYILREVAAAWGISHIYAVGDAVHCFKHGRYRSRIAKMHSSYDVLWKDVGGQVAAHGFYLIPAQNSRRSIHDVPSRKRAQHCRRYAMLDAISSEIRVKLTRQQPIDILSFMGLDSRLVHG